VDRKNIYEILNYFLGFPFITVDVEKSFSLLNIIKTRTRTNVDLLESLLMIQRNESLIPDALMLMKNLLKFGKIKKDHLNKIISK